MFIFPSLVTWGWGISIDCAGGDVTTWVSVTPADAAGITCVLTNGAENSEVTCAVELAHDVTRDVGTVDDGLAVATKVFTYGWNCFSNKHQQGLREVYYTLPNVYLFICLLWTFRGDKKCNSLCTQKDIVVMVPLHFYEHTYASPF